MTPARLEMLQVMVGECDPREPDGSIWRLHELVTFSRDHDVRGDNVIDWVGARYVQFQMHEGRLTHYNDDGVRIGGIYDMRWISCEGVVIRAWGNCGMVRKLVGKRCPRSY